LGDKKQGKYVIKKNNRKLSIVIDSFENYRVSITIDGADYR
jgi:hypothetical protein